LVAFDAALFSLPAFCRFSISPTWALNSLCTTSSTTSPYRSHHDLHSQQPILNTNEILLPVVLLICPSLKFHYISMFICKQQAQLRRNHVKRGSNPRTLERTTEVQPCPQATVLQLPQSAHCCIPQNPSPYQSAVATALQSSWRSMHVALFSTKTCMETTNRACFNLSSQEMEFLL
jgi:hypothetical protein